MFAYQAVALPGSTAYAATSSRGRAITTSVDTSTGTRPTLRSVARRFHPGLLDHEDRHPSRRTRPVDDALRDRVALVAVERDRVAVLEVDEQPAVEDEEEFVGVVVLVPVEVPVEHADADDGVVDRGQGLVEPRLVPGGLLPHVDEREMAVLLVEADVVVL